MNLSNDDHVYNESWEEDEVIIRVINEKTQLLLDLEEQRLKALNALREALQAYRDFLERDKLNYSIKEVDMNEPPF